MHDVDRNIYVAMFCITSAIAPRLVYQRPQYVLSCLRYGAYKKNLLLIGKSSP